MVRTQKRNHLQKLTKLKLVLHLSCRCKRSNNSDTRRTAPVRIRANRITNTVQPVLAVIRLAVMPVLVNLLLVIAVTNKPIHNRYSQRYNPLNSRLDDIYFNVISDKFHITQEADKKMPHCCQLQWPTT